MFTSIVLMEKRTSGWRLVYDPAPGHFYWPELDVDMGIEAIELPDRFRLKAK